ncbi:cell wall assembly and cell proliferation coordinating protein [Metschnikowia bicuspidata var. bicuspidata NRRL YB-4993]|uniref:Cell wall assembly and cell proliferation coordinating protein n=1 Tax=Metschnikowia bicuspidata var. bicuspidata NRRL YB-4993 TaxID=869754 RepID=A0A1A0H7W6_9ASCO|nr:cell wall assembly and cell proliferation coordinating protein [Metschnikowia bicuspidata var. bicuspidata NRRL YB-4993]OBA20116.1 cell wall assembly and cell proliferation coordinating protein [Metschnikowia bicuspidata var. bicuspidata NRRL YB-4993]
MGFMDSIKAFVHSVTTDDHYASYGSPYEHSSAGGSLGGQSNSSSLRLQELNSSLTHSLMSSRNASSSNIVGYRPGMRSSATNVSNSGAPGAHELQTFGANGQPPLPSIDSLWDRIEEFLEEEYPELEDSLNTGASSADLNELEKDLAAGPLPVEVRQFYKRHDGQFRGGKPTGLLMGLTLLDIESIMEEYSIWAKVAEKMERQTAILQHQQQQAASTEGTSASKLLQEKISNSYLMHQKISNSYLMHQKSIPKDAVQPYYVHRGWIPIARDYVGNMIALDLAPGAAGIMGQIILFGREFDTKVVVASNLQELLFHFITDLETGNYQIDKSESNYDNGFLDSSRSDDYMIGDEDEDNGELLFFDRDGAEFGKNSKNKLSYIEVLKRRALSRYGIAHSEKFQTSFTPHRISRKIQLPNGSSPRPSKSRTGSASQLVTVESATDLLKETLIGADAKVLTKNELSNKAGKSDLEAIEKEKVAQTEPASEVMKEDNESGNHKQLDDSAEAPTEKDIEAQTNNVESAIDSVTVVDEDGHTEIAL